MLMYRRIDYDRNEGTYPLEMMLIMMDLVLEMYNDGRSFEQRCTVSDKRVSQEAQCKHTLAHTQNTDSLLGYALSVQVYARSD